MPTYRFRHKFIVSHKGLLRGDANEIEFVLPNGHPAQLTSIDAKKIGEATSFEILSGGYPTEENARAHANDVKESVLCFGAKYRVGVNVGKDKPGGKWATSVTDKIFEDQGVRIIEDIHGVSVYSEEHPTSWMSFSAVGLVNAKDSNFFTNEVCEIISKPRKIDAKIRLSMELLTGSHFESSPRSRFLTLVLAAESILSPDERQEKSKVLVDELKRITKLSDTSEEDKKSMIGSLEWLYKDSISQSLRKMAQMYLPQKTYHDTNSVEFIKKCYDARSKLVHKGGVDESKYNIGVMAANLEVYMSDMLIALSGI